jgi:glucose/arabinose dehydrogenase
VAQNLQEPWSLAFAPDGRLFFTEAPGRLRVIAADGTLVPAAVLDISAQTLGFEGGLTGMDLDPGFEANGFVYAHFCTAALHCRVVRITVKGNVGTLDKTLLDYVITNFDHAGGRLKVGPDHLLYLTVGDHDNQNSAQDPASFDGKILRMNLDGTAAAGNPFPQNAFVYSMGHRDPQGLAWDSSGTLYETEHGPVANDEVNIITAGGNYGWPTCVGSCNNPAFIDPIVNLAPALPAMPPAGCTFYSGSTISGWDGSMLISFLGLDTDPVAHQIRQFVFDVPGGRTVTFQQALFLNQFGRIRDVAEGPDGFLYFATSNFKQGTEGAANDDRIIRVRPK